MMLTRKKGGLLMPIALGLTIVLASSGGAAVFGQEKPATPAQPAANAQPVAAQPAAAQPVAAQPQPAAASVTAQPLTNQHSISTSRVQPQQLRTTPGFVGPPESGTAAVQVPGAGKVPSDIPAPTVVLKPGEAPTIAFDTQTWDWGRIRSGPDVSHDFWFTNTGTGPLEILKVKPG